MNKKSIILVGLVICVIVIIVALIFYVRKAKPVIKNEPPVENIFNDSPAMSKDSIDQMKEYDRVNSPSTYLANMLPVDMPTFNMTFSIDENRKAIIFLVEPKEFSLQQVQEDVQSWLISIGLTDIQIESLIIEYDVPIN